MTNGYRDELAAARARIAALEEKLAEHDAHEKDDPVLARLLERRRVLERTAQQGSPGWVTAAVMVGVMLMPAITPLTRAHPDPTRVALSVVACTVLGLLLGWWTRFGVRRTAQAALAEMDAKLVEARRMRAIERGLRGKRAPEAEKKRVRIAVEEEEDAEAEEETRAAGRQKRR